MPASTRSGPRRRYLLRRWSRRGRGVVGGILLLIAGLAAWVALLGGIVAFAVVMDKDSGLDPALRPEVLTVWLWVVAVGTGAWFAARTLRAVPRRMVLWLRRFRHAESIRAVSTALDHLGYSWRVVTLDDATALPMGTAAGLRLTTSGATIVGGVVTAIRSWLSKWGTWVVRGYVAAWVGLVAWTIWQGRPWAVLDALSGDWTQWPVPGEVALARLLAGAGVAVFAALVAFIPLALLVLLLFPIWMMVGSIGTGVRAAELRKRQRVASRSELTRTVAAVAAGATATLAPRLTVISVESSIWQEAVHDFARSCDAVVLDVSSASAALLWEIREIGRGKAPVVFVGEEAAVTKMLSGGGGGQTAHDAALRDALDGREVIAYRTTLAGRVRFQRALNGALEASVPPPRPSAARARLWGITAGAVAVVVVGLWQIASLVTTWPWAGLFD